MAIDFKAISDSDLPSKGLNPLFLEIIFLSDETIGARIPLFCVRPRKSGSGEVSERPTSCSDQVIAPRKMKIG